MLFIDQHNEAGPPTQSWWARPHDLARIRHTSSHTASRVDHELFRMSLSSVLIKRPKDQIRLKVVEISNRHAGITSLVYPEGAE